MENSRQSHNDQINNIHTQIVMNTSQINGNNPEDPSGRKALGSVPPGAWKCWSDGWSMADRGIGDTCQGQGLVRPGDRRQGRGLAENKTESFQTKNGRSGQGINIKSCFTYLFCFFGLRLCNLQG